MSSPEFDTDKIDTYNLTEEILEKIDDQMVLARLVADPGYKCEMVLERLKQIPDLDQEALRYIIMHSNYNTVLTWAVESIDIRANMDWIIDMARDNSVIVCNGTYDLLTKGLERLEPEEYEKILFELVNDPRSCKWYLMEKLGELNRSKYQDFFAKVAQSEKHCGQLQAIENLNADQHLDVLRDIVSSEKFNGIWFKAVEKLPEDEQGKYQGRYIKIATEDYNPNGGYDDYVFEAIKKIDPDKHGEALMAIALARPFQLREVFEHDSSGMSSEEQPLQLGINALETLSKGKDALKLIELISKISPNAIIRNKAQELLESHQG